MYGKDVCLQKCRTALSAVTRVNPSTRAEATSMRSAGSLCMGGGRVTDSIRIAGDSGSSEIPGTLRALVVQRPTPPTSSRRPSLSSKANSQMEIAETNTSSRSAASSIAVMVVGRRRSGVT